MAPRLLILVTTICFYLSHFTVNGRKGRSNDVIKTIKTEDGVYDCFDFYKQPSLQHPLLKNHSFHHEMRPSITDTPPTFSNDDTLMNVNHNKVDCPKGTVPIRRLSKEDKLFQTQLRREHYAHLGGIRPNNNVEQTPTIANFALAQSKSAMTNAFHSLGATFSVHNPSVTAAQYSSAEIIVKGGTDVLIAGWTVNPMLYKDNRTRIFTYAIADESHCFNSHCGFVQVDSGLALNAEIRPISVPFKEMFLYPFLIHKDPRSGDWWLKVGWDYTALGFWPRQIFKGLHDSANYVACGGEVYGPSNVDKMKYPPMGWGMMPNINDPQGRWPHCKDIRVIHENDMSYTNFETYSSNDLYYAIELASDNSIAAYGGPCPTI